jgi:signal transduction histidine kinase
VEIVERAQGWWTRVRTALPMWVLDAVLATGLLVMALATVTADPVDTDVVYEPLDGWAYLLVLATTLPYYLRRRAPFAVFVVSTVGLITHAGLGYHEGGLPVVVLVGIYTVGAYRPPRLIAAAFAVLLVSLLVLVALDVQGFGPPELVENGAVFGFGLLFGWTVQSRRLRLEAAEERAKLLEREQAEEAARAVADERLRIAQELHDVVAHSMSVIAVQAGAGMHVVDADPAEAKRALENISTTSRSTLTELRRLLGVLRDDGSGAAYAPAPSLDDLGALAREVTDAGVPVEVTTDGSLGDLPLGVGSTGYRIVQEALTNVLKHAGPSTASVHVEHRPGALRIEVSDDGRGVNGRALPGGHGLLGMRERVAVYGGSLDAGPRPGGGYAVRAVLPYGATDDTRAGGAR